MNIHRVTLKNYTEFIIILFFKAYVQSIKAFDTRGILSTPTCDVMYD